MFVYLALELSAILIPLIYSYDRKLQFYLKLKSVAISLLLVGSFYIAGDILFTKYGIWGFNPRYHSGIVLFDLPLEEWLFFIVIPYASIFLHETLIYLYPEIKLNNRTTTIISVLVVVILGVVIIANIGKAYTAIYLTVAIVSILSALYSRTEILNRF